MTDETFRRNYRFNGQNYDEVLKRIARIHMGIFDDIDWEADGLWSTPEVGKPVECDGCNGKGVYQLLGPIMTCDKCNGTGKVVKKTSSQGANAPIKDHGIIVIDSRPAMSRKKLALAPGDHVEFQFGNSSAGSIAIKVGSSESAADLLQRHLVTGAWANGTYEITDVYDYSFTSRMYEIVFKRKV